MKSSQKFASELLQELMRREDAQQRIRDIATLLLQYVEYHSPWADRVELERAQQLTALNFLDPAKAKEWLDTAEADASLGRGDREWFIAMRQEIDQFPDLPETSIPNRQAMNLMSKILHEAKKVAPGYLYNVPEIEGYSKEKVVDEIAQGVQDGYLNALPINSQASPYPQDFQYIKITQKGLDFLRNEQEGFVHQQKILILAALPDRLRLDKEIQEIEEAIRRAAKRNLFEIKIRTAVRPQDIRRAIAEEHPQVVHFCGHGMEDGSLVLDDDEETRDS
jgi:hypothetical protein